MPKRKADAPADPDKLQRQAAGTYRTADGRFEVRNGDAGWFLVDSEQTNEFGQELMHGPFATLKTVRDAIPAARSPKVTALRRPSPPPPERDRAAEEPEAAPLRRRSWIDELPTAEARAVRVMIRALEQRRLRDAEVLVRQDREGFFPVIARRLLEERLAELVDDWPESLRPDARALVARVAEVLSTEGAEPDGPLPGWMLVELGPEPEPPNRRIDLTD